MISFRKRCIRASAALEAAVALPLFLVLLYFFLSVELAETQEYALRYAADHTAEEAALLFPLAEIGLEHAGEAGKTVLESILNGEDRSVLEQLAGDYSSSLFLGPLLERRMDYWLEAQRAGGGCAVPPHERRIILNWNRSGKSLNMEVYFTVPTLLGDMKRKLVSLIPLWSEYVPDPDIDGETGQDPEKDQVWSLDNFSRGRILREKFGSNLPFNYPVISEFRDGTAHSVRSMDLTAPGYRDPSSARAAIENELSELAAFQGYESKNGHAPSIRADEIKRRKWTLIIPQNAPGAYDGNFWSEVERKAGEYNIEFRKIVYGESSRYSKE